MMAETIDKVLELNHLFYLPVIEKDVLCFMLIFNNARLNSLPTAPPCLSTAPKCGRCI